jgi:hypothetical protein
MTGSRKLLASALLAVGIAAGWAPGVVAQAPAVAVSSGVDPAVVTVGDRFRVVVRIDAPVGVVVEFPEDVGITESYQSVGPVSLLPGEGDDPHVAVYPMVAWRTGTFAPPVAAVHLRTADGAEHVVRITLPMPEMRSVLPIDAVGVEPRGARDVMDADRPRSWWPWLLVVLLVLLLAALAGWWRRGRRRGGVRGVDPSARARALAELDEVRALVPTNDGEWKPYFSRLSGAVRGYLAALSPDWGRELTSAELLRAIDGEVDAEQRAALAGVLGEADAVKFARARARADTAEARWHDARRLVEDLEPASPASPIGADTEGQG